MKAQRDAWFDRFADVRLDQIVCVDEFGAATNMQRTHGRAAPGERVAACVPHGHWKCISTVAALTTRGIIASASFDAATDTELFVTFVTDVLAPTLAAGQVVVMDNLAPHKAPAVRHAIEAVGCRLMLLPPYSPDFNPIEMAISKVKTVLRKLARRDVPGLLDGIGRALQAITHSDATAYIRHSGYVL